MAEPDLSQTSLLDLIVELLAGRVEPVRLTALLAELHRRTGQDVDTDPGAWRDWFLRTYPLDEVGRLRLEYAETRRRIREIERRALRKLGR